MHTRHHYFLRLSKGVSCLLILFAGLSLLLAACGDYTATPVGSNSVSPVPVTSSNQTPSPTSAATANPGLTVTPGTPFANPTATLASPTPPPVDLPGGLQS